MESGRRSWLYTIEGTCVSSPAELLYASLHALMNRVVGTGQPLLINELGDRDVPVPVTSLLILFLWLFLLGPWDGEGVFVWVLSERGNAGGEEGFS